MNPANQASAKSPMANANELDLDALLADLARKQPRYLAFFKKAQPAARKPVPVVFEDPPASPLDVPMEDVPPVGPSAPRSEEPLSKAAGPSKPRPVRIHESNSDSSPASSEADEFEQVQTRRQKRKMRAAKSSADPPKKFGAAEPSPSPAPQASSDSESDSEMRQPPREKVPPLFIREKAAWERMLPIIDRLGVAIMHARSTAVGIRVQCPTSDDHRRLTAFLRKESIGYHTYALQDERVLRTVIRGLPREMSTVLIKEDLMAQGIPVTEVHRMYHHRTKAPFDMVLVISELSPEAKKIFAVRAICRLSGLSIEAPNNRGFVGQCHRCQLYGHCARNCMARARCVKCLGDHGTADCTRQRSTEEPPSCVLCQSKGHPANYRGCPKAPKEPRRRLNRARGGPPAAPKPKQRFVPAPMPSTSAWNKPLFKGAVNPPQPEQGAAGKPGRVPEAPRPSAAKPVPTPSASASAGSSATERLASNWAFANFVIDNVDIESLDDFAQMSKSNFVGALEKYRGLLAQIKKVRNTLNG